MTPLDASELARYWEFEPVCRNYNGKMKVNQFFGKENTSLNLQKLYVRYGWLGHNGLDISAEYVHCYAPVKCTVQNFRDEKDNEKARGDFLNLISEEREIHGHRVRLVIHYFHLNDVLVDDDLVDDVIAGEAVAVTGNTGLDAQGKPLSTGPHLHFGVYPEYFEGGKWVRDGTNGYGGAVDPIWFFNPKDVGNYPTKIKKSMALRLIKGMNSGKVYALGLDGKKHALETEAQLKLGSQIGLWVDESKIETRVQAEIDELLEGNPISIGVK